MQETTGLAVIIFMVLNTRKRLRKRLGRLLKSAIHYKAFSFCIHSGEEQEVALEVIL